MPARQPAQRDRQSLRARRTGVGVAGLIRDGVVRAIPIRDRLSLGGLDRKISY